MRFGLSADIAFVTAVHAGASGDGRIGIPISSEESEELRRRDAVLADLNALRSRYERSDPAWAGTWLDQQEGGLAHVAFTRALSQREREAVQRRLPAGSPILFHQWRHPLRSLEALAARLRRDVREWQAEGVVLLVYGVSTTTNTVTVTINVDAPATAEAALKRRYGAATDGRLRITRGPGLVLLSG